MLRAWLGRIPSRFSRCVSCAVLIGRPGRPPGKSHGDGAGAPKVACPLRSVGAGRTAESGREDQPVLGPLLSGLKAFSVVRALVPLERVDQLGSQAERPA